MDLYSLQGVEIEGLRAELCQAQGVHVGRGGTIPERVKLHDCTLSLRPLLFPLSSLSAGTQRYLHQAGGVSSREFEQPQKSLTWKSENRAHKQEIAT